MPVTSLQFTFNSATPVSANLSNFVSPEGHSSIRGVTFIHRNFTPKSFYLHNRITSTFCIYPHFSYHRSPLIYEICLSLQSSYILNLFFSSILIYPISSYSNNFHNPTLLVITTILLIRLTQQSIKSPHLHNRLIYTINLITTIFLPQQSFQSSKYLHFSSKL